MSQFQIHVTGCIASQVLFIVEYVVVWTNLSFPDFKEVIKYNFWTCSLNRTRFSVTVV